MYTYSAIQCHLTKYAAMLCELDDSSCCHRLPEAMVTSALRLSG